MEWKWTKGDPYERSRRLKHVEEYENKKFTTEMESSAYTTSLNHDENTWDILNQEFSKVNKREDLDNKIADRELIQQRGFNPFLGETNYADDISNKFLKPVNTTQDKVKTS